MAQNLVYSTGVLKSNWERCFIFVLLMIHAYSILLSIILKEICSTVFILHSNLLSWLPCYIKTPAKNEVHSYIIANSQYKVMFKCSIINF